MTKGRADSPFELRGLGANKLENKISPKVQVVFLRKRKVEVVVVNVLRQFFLFELAVL